MEFVRVLTNPRRSMQRFGFLKYLVWRASITATNNVTTIGKDLIAAASQKVSEILTDELNEYIRIALTDATYRNIRAISLKPTQNSMDRPKVSIELQDFYLADVSLPSKRGKLVLDDWNRYPQLAVDLGLLRKGTYSLLVRGQSFLLLVTESEKKAFSRSGIGPLSRGTNPFKLTQSQKMFFLFSLIEHDAYVLRDLYKTLLQFSKPFSGKEAGYYLPAIYRTIADKYRPKARSGDDLLTVQRLLDTALNIELVGRKTSPGGKNPREHNITVRLEPFVDCDILSKPNPFIYQYQITPAARIFFGELIAANDTKSFLNQSFFGTMNKSFNLHAVHKPDTQSIIPVVIRAYNELKSPLGYVPLLDVCLLAGIYNITGGGTYFEISEATEMLISLQKEKPYLVTFNVDRWGQRAFLKLNSSLSKSLEQ